MIGRTVVAFVIGLVIAVVLFVAMQALISRPRSANLRPDTSPVIDFVRLDQDQPPPPQTPRQPPDQPPLPEALPTPRLSLSTPQRPQLNAPQLNPTPTMTSPITPLGLLNMAALPAPSAAAPSDEGGLADQELIALVRVPPRYPIRASRFQIEGFVTVEFTIGEDGSVREPQVVESSPPKVFDDAALQAIVQWKFKPRTRQGQAVASRASQRIDFALQKR